MTAAEVVADVPSRAVTIHPPLDAYAEVLTLLAEAVAASTLIAHALDQIRVTAGLLDDDRRAYLEPGMTFDEANGRHTDALKALWAEILCDLTPEWRMTAAQARSLASEVDAKAGCVA